ncbi:MAG: YraN family protein [Eubacteriales bacterium]|nr:YraN family protein [Eubacteriales bacterium]
MTDSNYQKGLGGEERAERYLVQTRGMVPLERRYHSPFGEIDLVMRDGETLAFVEVKARSRGRRGAGLMAVTREKQRRLTLTALQYIAQHKTDCPIRFDVIELTADGVAYVPNAFEAKEY